MTQMKTTADAGSTPAGSTTLKENKMKLSKRQLKRIIREEYSKLKRQGLINESWNDRMKDMELAARPHASHMNLPAMDDQLTAHKEEMAPKRKGRHMPNGTILDLAAQPGGIELEELLEMFGEDIFDRIDELEADGLLRVMDDGMVVSMRGY